jgi:hypothetical protein
MIELRWKMLEELQLQNYTPHKINSAVVVQERLCGTNDG